MKLSSKKVTVLCYNVTLGPVSFIFSKNYSNTLM